MLLVSKQVKRNLDNIHINREQFIQIWGFMLTDLGLAHTELLVYAVIFAMYHHHCEYFVGSRRYLQKWCNAGKTAVENALASLEKKGLIIKEYRLYGSVSRAVYRINTATLPRCDMFAEENINADADRRIKAEESRAERLLGY